MEVFWKLQSFADLSKTTITKNRAV